MGRSIYFTDKELKQLIDYTTEATEIWAKHLKHMNK